VIDHDGVTGENPGLCGNRWCEAARRAGGRIPFHHTHVELKVDVNVAETRSQWKWVTSDVRASRAPPSRYRREQPDREWPFRSPIDGLRVRLVATGLGRTLGDAITDESGQARISLPPDLTYPIEAQIEVSDLNGPVLKSENLFCRRGRTLPR